MKAKYLITIIAAFAAAGSSQALAQNAQSSRAQYYGEAPSADNPVGFVPFIGIGAGYMDRNDTIETEGTPANIRLLGSYYTESLPLVYDFGLGVVSQTFSQHLNDDRTVTGGLIDLAARYEFGNRWQFGPVANGFVGTGSRYQADSGTAIFAGLGLAKEFTVNKENILRVGLDVMTDLNIPGEAVNVGFLNIAMGFGNYKKTSAHVEQPVAAVKTPETPAETPDRTIQSRGIASLDDPKRTEFEFNQANPDRSEQAYLRKLAAELKNRPGLVKRIEVVGHADQIGSEQYNMELSEKRAENVAGILARSGVPADMIKKDWKGENEPIVNSTSNDPAELKENRRVEIKFYGVKDKDQLEEVLKRVE